MSEEEVSNPQCFTMVFLTSDLAVFDEQMILVFFTWCPTFAVDQPAILGLQLGLTPARLPISPSSRICKYN